MGRRIGFVLKLLAGAYLIFVGVTLLNTILEIRPGNQEVMCGIAAVFILVGAVYLIILVGGVIKERWRSGRRSIRWRWTRLIPQCLSGISPCSGRLRWSC